MKKPKRPQIKAGNDRKKLIDRLKKSRKTHIKITNGKVVKNDKSGKPR